MQTIKCMFCSKPTTTRKKTVKKKINEKTVTLTNAPVNFCDGCNELFISPQTQMVINHIKDNNLTEKQIIFDCDAIIKEIR